MTGTSAWLCTSGKSSLKFNGELFLSYLYPSPLSFISFIIFIPLSPLLPSPLFRLHTFNLSVIRITLQENRKTYESFKILHYSTDGSKLIFSANGRFLCPCKVRVYRIIQSPCDQKDEIRPSRVHNPDWLSDQNRPQHSGNSLQNAVCSLFLKHWSSQSAVSMQIPTQCLVLSSLQHFFQTNSMKQCP